MPIGTIFFKLASKWFIIKCVLIYSLAYREDINYKLLRIYIINVFVALCVNRQKAIRWKFRHILGEVV